MSLNLVVSDIMGKRRLAKHGRTTGDSKRIKASEIPIVQLPSTLQQNYSDTTSVRVLEKDKVEKKVDIIVRDVRNNSNHSLSIWGTGLGVEKTIAVVEELKRTFTKQGTRCNQETSIKLSDDNEPHLQVILTLIRSSNL